MKRMCGTSCDPFEWNGRWLGLGERFLVSLVSHISCPARVFRLLSPHAATNIPARIPTLSHARGDIRFRSPGKTPQASVGTLGGEPPKPLSSATLSPNSDAGGRERGVTATLSSASSILSPGVKPRQYTSESTTDPSSSGLSGRGRSVRGGGVGAAGTVQGPLSPPRPLVAGANRSRLGLTDSEIATGTQESVSSPGPRAGGASKRRFFFGADTVRSLASSLSTPDFERPLALPGAASKLPVDPTADRDNKAHRSRGGRAGSRQSRSLSRDSSGGERGWAEIVSGEKGELPSLLAPLDLQARDGEGVGHQVRLFWWVWGGTGRGGSCRFRIDPKFVVSEAMVPSFKLPGFLLGVVMHH